MGTEQEIHEMHTEIDELKKYPLKLTWKQTWGCIVVICGVFGGIFGAGLKVQSEIDKVEVAKLERAHQNELQEMDEKMLTVKRELAEAKEEYIFYKNRNVVLAARLEKCIHANDSSNVFIQSFEEE